MKLNKKGFTLVELLAVIVILAVIMLVAVTAIGPVIEDSRKSGFFSTASSVVDAATLLYTQKNEKGCQTIQDLVDAGYLQKKDGNLNGSVYIESSNGNITYYLYITNNQYSVTNKEITDIDSKGNGFDNSVPTTAITNCGGRGA